LIWQIWQMQLERGMQLRNATTLLCLRSSTNTAGATAMATPVLLALSNITSAKTNFNPEAGSLIV
jgi:hypothetical protein